MRTRLAAALAAMVGLLAAGLVTLAAPAASATEPTTEPSATAEPTTEPSATAEPTTEPSATAEPTAEPTQTAEPTAEPSATGSATPVPAGLPVTGSTPGLFALAGLAALGSGVLLFVLARRRREVTFRA